MTLDGELGPEGADAARVEHDNRVTVPHSCEKSIGVEKD
jgi:hypothetical protein